MELETSLGYTALLPLWFRIAAVWLAVALSLAIYRERRAAGDPPAEAVLKVFAAAFVAPVQFVIELFTKKA